MSTYLSFFWWPEDRGGAVQHSKLVQASAVPDLGETVTIRTSDGHVTHEGKVVRRWWNHFEAGSDATAPPTLNVICGLDNGND